LPGAAILLIDAGRKQSVCDLQFRLAQAFKLELSLKTSTAETLYDIAIIGGGPAGYTAAIRGAQLGLRVALIEAARVLGGTCLNVGCIPTKALLFNAELWEHLKHAAEYGIDGVAARSLNWKSVQARKDSIVHKHRKGLEFLMKKNNVTVISGYARLAGHATDGVHTVDVAGPDGTKHAVTAKNVILATGSDAKTLFGLEPDDRILTNVEMLNVSDVPKSLIVIGGGAVGVEFASIFRTFGAQIALLEFQSSLVPVEDEEISKELMRLFKKRGIDVNTGAKVEKIERTAAGVKVEWIAPNGNRMTKEADKVLLAVGRAPRIADLGIENTRIERERGFVKVDEAHQTAEPGIYAIGDIVAGLPQLAHVGAMSGIVAVTKIAGRPYRAVKPNRVPACTYSEPQIGSVGLTEQQARSAGVEIRVGRFPFAGNSKATILGNHDGFVKVIADAHSGEILGVHIIGPQATELIAEAVTVIDLEGMIDELLFTIHAHPTLGEAMLDAYAAVEGMAINA
jgi:dihydrolipoamide dehydrogenase